MTDTTQEARAREVYRQYRGTEPSNATIAAMLAFAATERAEAVEEAARVVETSWVLDGHMKMRTAAAIRSLTHPSKEQSDA